MDPLNTTIKHLKRGYAEKGIRVVPMQLLGMEPIFSAGYYFEWPVNVNIRGIM